MAGLRPPLPLRRLDGRSPPDRRHAIAGGTGHPHGIVTSPLTSTVRTTSTTQRDVTKRTAPSQPGLMSLERRSRPLGGVDEAAGPWRHLLRVVAVTTRPHVEEGTSTCSRAGGRFGGTDCTRDGGLWLGSRKQSAVLSRSGDGRGQVVGPGADEVVPCGADLPAPRTGPGSPAYTATSRLGPYDCPSVPPGHGQSSAQIAGLSW